MTPLESTIAQSMRQAEIERRTARRQILVNHADTMKDEQAGDPVTLAAVSAIREQQALELSIVQGMAMRQWSFWARLCFLFTRRLP